MIKWNRVSKINEIASSHINGNHSWCKEKVKKQSKELETALKTLLKKVGK